MIYYALPKKYDYRYKNLDNNQGLKYLKEQLDIINSINIEILNKSKLHLNTSSESFVSKIIIDDINDFINQLEIAKKDIYRQYKIYSKGAIGENNVSDIIYTYDNEWKIISNARLIIEGNSIENDFIIISKTGLFTIEVKNIGNSSETLKVDKLGRVSRYNKFNKEIETYDMIMQSNRHLGYLNKFINKNIDYKVPIRSLIVLASNIKVINKSEFSIIGPNQIYNIINSYSSLLEDYKLDELNDLFLNNIVCNTKYNFIDYIPVLEKNYKLILLAIKEFNDNN